MSGRYRTIVADPPWRVKRPAGWNTLKASIPLTYPTMSVDAIAALRVSELADDDAHLYLWTIQRYVEDAYAIAREWGFRPVTLLTWCKASFGLGAGGTFAHTTEHVLLAKRGTLSALRRVEST